MPPSPPRPSATSPVCKILLVDDDPAILRAVPRLLAPDFDVVTAAGAREALLLLARGEIFDAAIVDLQMPSIDGRQTIDLLLKVAPLLGERAIIMTGSVADADLQRWADALGPGRVVRKPPIRELLIETLNKRIEAVPEKPLVPTKSTMRPKKRR
jgi:two-component system NtrC family sensor kinase